MITRLDLRGITGDLLPRLPRPTMAEQLPVTSVRALLDEVKAGGDAAVRALTERFDGAAIPARVAGGLELVLCGPPEPDGRVPDVTLAAAAIAGVDEVYRVGGVQAVGAMAYGTETIRAVDVIVGPGSVFVSVAKRLVAQEGTVGVPSAFAGPSEVVVVADETAPAEYAATDMLVQAEHGPDGMAWLVTWS